MSTPKVILGTMTFGLESSDPATTAARVHGAKNTRPYLELFSSFGYTELDTARLYCKGDTEKVLGMIVKDHFKIATKVWPAGPRAHGATYLKQTLRESLEALNAKRVDTFYLHAPDYTTPFEETLKAVDELYREGLFKRFGLSNYSAWQVALIHQICKQNGYILPTVYQGLYNAVTRDVCKELIPCLRTLGIAFYAYNPIAGGILSGKYTFESEEGNASNFGRFDTKTLFGPIYRKRYGSKQHAEAIRNLILVAAENGMTLLEASIRWINHHAGLGPSDGIIIGTSSQEHLHKNIQILKKGPLPQAMVQAFDEAWEHTRNWGVSYFRTDSTTMADN